MLGKQNVHPLGESKQPVGTSWRTSEFATIADKVQVVCDANELVAKQWLQVGPAQRLFAVRATHTIPPEFHMPAERRPEGLQLKLKNDSAQCCSR